MKTKKLKIIKQMGLSSCFKIAFKLIGILEYKGRKKGMPANFTKEVLRKLFHPFTKLIKFIQPLLLFLIFTILCSASYATGSDFEGIKLGEPLIIDKINSFHRTLNLEDNINNVSIDLLSKNNVVIDYLYDDEIMKCAISYPLKIGTAIESVIINKLNNEDKSIGIDKYIMYGNKNEKAKIINRVDEALNSNSPQFLSVKLEVSKREMNSIRKMYITSMHRIPSFNEGDLQKPRAVLEYSDTDSAYTLSFIKHDPSLRVNIIKSDSNHTYDLINVNESSDEIQYKVAINPGLGVSDNRIFNDAITVEHEVNGKFKEEVITIKTTEVEMPELEFNIDSDGDNSNDTLVVKNISPHLVTIKSVETDDYIEPVKSDAPIAIQAGGDISFKLKRDRYISDKTAFKIHYNNSELSLVEDIEIGCNHVKNCAKPNPESSPNNSIPAMSLVEPSKTSERQIISIATTPLTVKYNVTNNSDKTMPLSIYGIVPPLYLIHDKDNSQKICGTYIGGHDSCIAKLLVYPQRQGLIQQPFSVEAQGSGLTYKFTDEIKVSVEKGPQASLEIIPYYPNSEKIASIRNIICPNKGILNIGMGVQVASLASVCESSVVADDEFKLRYMLKNNSSDTLKLTSAYVNDENFITKFENGCTTLASGGTCSVNVLLDRKKLSQMAEYSYPALKVNFKKKASGLINLWFGGDSSEESVSIPIIIEKAPK